MINVELNKPCTTIWICFFLVQITFGQDPHSVRELRLWTLEEDTVSVYYERDKYGDIDYLWQEHIEVVGSDTFLIREQYKKNKYWEITRGREIVVKQKKRLTITDFLFEGSFYRFRQSGQLSAIWNFKNDIQYGPKIYYEYYPDGQLMVAGEFLNNELWNIIEYYTPDGAIHDYGDYKNGNGKIIWLANDGWPCVECSYIRKKKKRKTIAANPCEDEQ